MKDASGTILLQSLTYATGVVEPTFRDAMQFVGARAAFVGMPPSKTASRVAPSIQQRRISSLRRSTRRAWNAALSVPADFSHSRESER
jgi:hypothetical protein